MKSAKRIAYEREYRQEHKEQVYANHKRWRDSHPAKVKEISHSVKHRNYVRQCKIELRQKILDNYGQRCACCGETELRFLTIDHINNNGAEHRKTKRSNSYGVYRDIIRRGFPKDEFQILCWNCNAGKYRNGGICPHCLPKDFSI